MAQARKINDQGGRLGVSASSSLRPLAVLTILAGVPFFLLVRLLPAGHVVPWFSLVTLATAGSVALFAWLARSERNVDRITAWDIAGVLAFLGFAAGMVSQAAQTAHLFGLAMVES